jgi:hypothetical protein
MLQHTALLVTLRHCIVHSVFKVGSGNFWKVCFNWNLVPNVAKNMPDVINIKQMYIYSLVYFARRLNQRNSPDMPQCMVPIYSCCSLWQKVILLQRGLYCLFSTKGEWNKCWFIQKGAIQIYLNFDHSQTAKSGVSVGIWVCLSVSFARSQHIVGVQQQHCVGSRNSWIINLLFVY